MNRDELDSLIADLSELHERSVGGTWEYSGLPVDFRDELLSEVMGFRIEATRVECKCKLSQNRVPEDRRRVAHALRESSAAPARAVARWMTELNDRAKRT